MNRLGIVIDASHSSDATFDQLLELSKYPILLSHSSLRSAHDHPRNLDEGRLKKLAPKGRAMCISTIYMSDVNISPARAKLFGEYEHTGDLTPEAQADLARPWRELDTSGQRWAAHLGAYVTLQIGRVQGGPP